jgi:hypothetical protein
VTRERDSKTLSTLYTFREGDRTVRVLLPAPGHPIRPEGNWVDVFGNPLHAPSEHAMLWE